MPSAIAGIDHVVLLVRDLDAAHDDFVRLGFQLTPRGHHSIGTQNHCLMFGMGYLELLKVVQPHPITEYFSAFLAEREGAAAIAFSSDDANAAFREFRERGLQADAPVDFSRPVDVPGGPLPARFRVVQLPVDATPGCRAFVCQHDTPELVWRPEYLAHPIGARAIEAVTVSTPDPEATAQRYARVAGRPPARTADGHTLRLGSAEIRFVADRDVGGPGSSRLSAVHLAIDDRTAAADWLRKAGVHFDVLPDGALRVGEATTHGVALVFT